jgi:hypothetical protein
MKRVSIQTVDGERTGQWFDKDAAQSWGEASQWDGNNFISVATGSQFNHEMLFRTTGGRWILNSWSNYQGSLEKYIEISPKEAAKWLVVNDLPYPDDLEELVTELEV